jgi:hypothetical protein
VIIQHAVWFYLRFTLSYRDVEELLLAERGLEISYETVRCWVLKFGPVIARRLRRCRPRPSNRCHLDEVVVVRIAGERMYLWRAVDHEGEVLGRPPQLAAPSMPSRKEDLRLMPAFAQAAAPERKAMKPILGREGSSRREHSGACSWDQPPRRCVREMVRVEELQLRFPWTPSVLHWMPAWTPVRWHIYDTGGYRRINTIQFGNGNSEVIDSMTAYEIEPNGTKVGTGLQAYPGNVYTYTYSTTPTQMPLRSRRPLSVL